MLVFTNGIGSPATSNAATLTVNFAPDITTQPTNQTVTAGQPIGPLGFIIGDAQTPAAQLTVTGVSNNTALVPTANIRIIEEHVCFGPIGDI